MYYASIDVLAFLINAIINYNILLKKDIMNRMPALHLYRRFLNFLMLYYIMDMLWEILYAFDLKTAIFYETEIYYVVMAITVLVWTQFVVEYIRKKTLFLKILKITGGVFLVIQLIVLALNIFYPIAFWFDENMNYNTGKARDLNYLFQFLMFFITAAYMFFETATASGKIKNRYLAIEGFCIVMSLFIVLQSLYPMLPYYAIGFVLGTCIIHTFVTEAEISTRTEELEQLMKIEEIQEAEIITARRMAFKDPLTSVKSKSAYQEDVCCLDSRIENNDLKDFALMVFDVNNLKKTNDQKGHEEGDKIIKEAAKIICKTFKHSPVYRIGGDEFTAFLSGDDYQDKERLEADFKMQIEKNRAEGGVVVACGITDFIPGEDTSFAKLFSRADAKMYENKKSLKQKT